MVNNSIFVDLDDPRTGKIAEAITNKTCKKILVVLTEEELRESDIARKLGLPMNTVEYNLKKLIEAGLIEKSKNYFWSVKGKRTPVYKLANKKIVISPKSIIKGVVPSVLASGVVALLLRNFIGVKSNIGISESYDFAQKSSASLASRSSEILYSTSLFNQNWTWFFIGALFSLIIFFIWNWIINRRNF